MGSSTSSHYRPCTRDTRWIASIIMAPRNDGLDGPEEPKPETGYATLATLRIGTKAMVEKDGEKRKAEILSMQTRKGRPTFYVHYQEFNKRLDEWVSAERLDLSQEVEWPLPEKPEPKSKQKQQPSKAQQVSKTDSKATKSNKRPRSATATRETSEAPEAKASRRPSQQGGKENRDPTVTIATEEIGGTPQPGEDDSTIDLVDMQEAAIAAKAAPEHAPYSREEEIEKLWTGGSTTQNQTEISRVRNLERIQMGGFEIEPWYFSPFLFYCMTARSAHGHHLVGYFSKEKESAEGYNVACILTLPQHQRKGYGKLLIQFSYELSKIEGKLGSPEKPLSDLGLLGYRAYWQEVIVDLLAERESEGTPIMSVEDLGGNLAMTTNDVLHTLQNLNMLRYNNKNHVIVLTDAVLEQRERQKEKERVKGKRAIDSAYLRDWKPPVFVASARTWNW